MLALQHESRPPSGESTPTVPTIPRDRTIDTALRLPGEQLEHAIRNPGGQGIPHVADPDRPQEPKLVQHCSPVTCLPPEILAYIFEHYVAHSEEWMPADSVLAHGPFCIAQVCTLWRAVAESDPHLWTSIHLYFPVSHASREEDVSMVKPILDLHLKWSKTLPISLIYADHRVFERVTKGLVLLLVDRLRTHARRWKRISMELPTGYFSDLFTFTPCDLSSLEYLGINGNMFTHASSISLSLDLESATKLQSFSYCGPGRLAEDRIDLHWENLSEASFGFAPYRGLTFASYGRFIDLAQCKNITTCSLGIDRPPRRGANENITLPCLQTLRVRRLSPYAHASGSINPLILPQLQTLEIDASSLVIRNQRWHDRTFSDLLARSGCTLLHLSIQDVDFPTDELVRCLALSPELTSLRLIPCPRSQDISDVMRRLKVSLIAAHGGIRSQRRRQGRAAVPQLREITLGSSVKGHLDSMMAMFRSRVGASARAAGVASFRRIEVVFFDLWHDADVDRALVLEDRLERVASFRAGLARWVSENRNDGDERLEASVVVDSPYLPGYIDVR